MYNLICKRQTDAGSAVTAFVESVEDMFNIITVYTVTVILESDINIFLIGFAGNSNFLFLNISDRLL